MAAVTSLSELKQVLLDARTESLVKASQEASDYVQDVVIEQEVYGKGNPQDYERTYDLKNSITERPVTGARSEVASVIINHNTNLISFNPDMNQHGNHSHGSVAHAIPDIVHDGLSGSAFGDGYWRAARPYMDVAAKDLSGGRFKRFMEDELRGMGFTVL